MKKLMTICWVVVCGISVAAPVKSILGARNTSIESREAATYTAKDYIQDGLIAMWDGIENAGWEVHDENATKWYDLVNGIHNIIPNASAVYSWGENYFHFGGRGQASASNSVDFYKSLTNGEITVQCVMKDMSDWSNVTGETTIFGAHWNSFLLFATLSTRGKLCVYLANGYEITTTCEYEQNFSYTATLLGTVQSAYVNATKKNSRTANRSPQSKTFGFGYPSGYGYAPHIVDMYAIRIYSKALTDKEIAYNYKIDKARFNLPE